MPISPEQLEKIKAKSEDIREMYRTDPRQKSLNVLITGELGSGKSFLARTARKPLHIDSFDPGGTKGLRRWIESGEIIVDSRWESEDPKNPSMFLKWKKEMAEREKLGYFDALGTYMIDSSTFWAEAIMNSILKRENIAGQAPRWSHDYVPQKMEIRNWVREMLDLPCDFFMTGHLEGTKDDVTGALSYRYMTTGQGTVLIPALFDEVWVMSPKKVPDGVKYRILTKATGTYLARSRLAEEGLLDVYEDADFKEILKKAGFDYEDKPLI